MEWENMSGSVSVLLILVIFALILIIAMHLLVLRACWCSIQILMLYIRWKNAYGLPSLTFDGLTKRICIGGQ